MMPHWHGQGGSQTQQRQLTRSTTLVALFDQLPPARGESEPSTRQRRAHADADEDQYPLPHRHVPNQQQENGSQYDCQRGTPHHVL
jgi:hypothetical protein